MFIYYFDSLSTRIREYKTIRGAEFFTCSNIILDPSQLPALRNSMKNQHQPRDMMAEDMLNFLRAN